MAIAVPVERRVIRDGVPALGKLTMWLWAWGLMMLLTLFCRAMFGTAEGLVGWIPFAGRLVKSPIHRIEQKVSHLIGGAVRPIDAHIATQWHTLAQTVRSIPGQLVDDAGLIFGLAAALVVLPSVSLVRFLIHAGTMPIHAAERQLDALLSRLRQGYKGVSHFVGHNIWARLLGLAAIVGGIIAHDLPGLRARERALEHDLAKLRDWVKHRKIALTTGAFIGALVWALGKLGIGYVRCANVKKVGRALCRAPSPLIDALIVALLAEFAFANLDTLMRLSSAIIDETTGDMFKALGLPAPPRGRFTIE